jgi:hypothetical protein
MRTAMKKLRRVGQEAQGTACQAPGAGREPIHSRNGDPPMTIEAQLEEAMQQLASDQAAEAAKAREEIHSKGTYWAGEEIARLRRELGALKRQFDSTRKLMED